MKGFRNQIIDLTTRNPDWSSAEIARVVGCHDAYVRCVWQRAGLSTPRSKRPLKDGEPIGDAVFREAIVELYNGFAQDVLGTDCREEAMIVLASLIGPVFADESEIARTLGYPRDHVIQIGRRLRRSGHWDGPSLPKFSYDQIANNENGLESNLCFAMMVMVAAGKIYAERQGDDFIYSAKPFPVRMQIVRDETAAA